MKKVSLSIAMAAIAISSSAHALVVTPSTATNLASNISGAGITISNVSYIGAARASGLFTGAGSDIGIDSGVLLTTGSAARAVGPNNTDSESTNNSLPGNAELSVLSGASTFDATILSFDFEFISGLEGDLFLNYVFASEEYNEFVNEDVNDVFAFYVDGINVATLPGGDPVSIDTVNLDSNSSLYNDNSNGSFDIEYDGFTDVLQVAVLGLSAGIHTMSFAIADGGDRIYDSGVFLQASSFSSINPTMAEVSEPMSLALFGLGLTGLCFSRRKKIAHNKTSC